MIDSLTELAIALSGSAALSALMKTAVAGLCGLAAARIAYRSRAAVRHAILAATFAVMFAIPFVAATAPAVAIRIPVTSASVAPAAERAIATPPVPRPGVATPLQAGKPMAISFSMLAAAAWTIGTVLFLCWFSAGIWQLQRIRRTGLPWLEARAVVNTLAAQARIEQPVDVLVHEDVAAPLMCGLRRPAIILPTDVQEWSEPALRRALVHELEHVRRRDWWVHLGARVVCAVYWFNPIVWFAYRQLSLEAERACDDAVMEREEPTQYAEQLVELARRMTRRRAQPALAMASRSDLARRVAAVLDTRQIRGRAGIARASLVGVLAVAVVIVLSPIRLAGTVTASSTLDADGQLDRGRARVSRADRALVEAAEEDSLAEIQGLLDAGADVNATVDGDGSPLIMAARAGRLAVVRFLLDRGADVNLPVAGDGNPLIMAAREGHLPIVQVLLDRGANVNQIVPGDENALIQASGAGRLDVVRLLVARNADVNARVWAERAFERPNGEWRTALNMARRAGHADVVAFLLSAGAVE
jgi:beta-lactamase regulating signal transducer with metallopeptidase domain